MYLNCHSYFSLRYGTLSPAELVAAAVKRNLPVLALTDINNTSAAFDFVQLCKEAGIKPIIGIEFRKDNRWLYTGLAKNWKGFYQLNKLLTDCSLDGKELPEVPPEMLDTFIIYPRLIKPIECFEENEFLGVRPEHVNRLYFAEVRHHQHKLVALNPITFLDKEGFELHQLLRAIDLNTLHSKLTQKDIAKQGEYFLSQRDVQTLYDGFPTILENTKKIINFCSINFKKDAKKYNRQTFTGSKDGDFQLLEKLAYNGCAQRYGAQNTTALDRVKKELKVIKQQEFCAYFLITWDIIRYGQSLGYHHVGRGSGANSIVAFCLLITDVDPLELDLYFERFINPYRSSPPDFDIDFSWNIRDDVTDYIFKRYGREYTALLATYSTFKGKSIIRELGKVFGLPKAEIDIIVNYPNAKDRHHELAQKIAKYGKLMEGFPNYLSIHAGGIIISEKPINCFTALQLMPKGFPITNFDMYGAEKWGFHKFDVLSQRGLGHIKDAVDLVKQNQGKAVDIHEVHQIMEDPKVKAKLKEGHCIGCFYIESPAMRSLLKKLRCDNYKHLVAASSIIRPGVSKSGMMKEFIKRFHSPNSFKYLHPVFEEHLAETFGVMVYQEDTMKIIHHFAGLDLDESDVLRRIMSGKKYKKETLQKLRTKYYKNCKERGYTRELAEEVWRQVESFSGYSFCKAHSASFAVESFQSLYLKAHYPLEFMVAVINNFGGFYQTEYYFHEAKLSGATIHAPCVNKSEYLTHIEGTDVYVGLIHLHRMEQKIARKIIQQRKEHGPYRHLPDFVDRLPITADQLEILIRINAFRFTQKSKCELMWEKNAVFTPRKDWEASGTLFGREEENYQLPQLKEGKHDQAFDEIELLGFPLCSPFELLKDQQNIPPIRVEELAQYRYKKISILGYYVCKKNVRTINDKIMAFGTWLDEQGQFFDTTHFPPCLEKYPFRGKAIYKITGVVASEFGFCSIEVESMEMLPLVGDGRYE